MPATTHRDSTSPRLAVSSRAVSNEHHYKSNLRDTLFNLFEFLDIGRRQAGAFGLDDDHRRREFGEHVKPGFHRRMDAQREDDSRQRDHSKAMLQRPGDEE